MSTSSVHTSGNAQLATQARGYLDLWAKYISDGLAQIKGSPVTVESLAASPPAGAPSPASDGALWIRAFGGKAGEHAFMLTQADARALAQMLMGKPPKEAEGLNGESREAIVQFFEQIATMIPASSWLGVQNELAISEAERPAWESAAGATFRFSTPEGRLLDLEAALSGDFLAALQGAGNSAATAAGTPASTVARAPRDTNLELLLDVELEATLRFGQREMLLGDILKLAPGSVIELGQDISDPVELLIGEKVIAWGEVVTVDGNYGLRVTGLASREERIESLRGD